MDWLPLAVSFLLAAALAPPLLERMREAGLTRPNYRGREAACPAGILVFAAAALSLVAVAPLHEWDELDLSATVLLFVLGVGLLGLIDDMAGGGNAGPRGVRGHAEAAGRGQLSTGALKAAGTLGLALLAASDLGLGSGTGEYLLAAALLTSTTHVFNLLDLRPGRSIKVLVLLGAGLTIGSADLDPLWTLGLFAGPVLVLLRFDLNERAMLGDTGSGAVGAIAGLWLVLTLGTTGQAIALAVAAAAAIYGELRSISELVDRNPLLRSLDSLGRPDA